MKRRTFLSSLFATATLIGSAGAAAAASYTEDVVAQLVQLGFSDITAETTLLGRVKIRAMRADGMREVVINPRTGEILRDIWIPSGNGAPRTVLNDIDDDQGSSDSGRNEGDNSGSGNGDDNSDSSGSGSGGDDDNSGSGNGDDSNNGDDSDNGDDNDSGGDNDSGDDRDDREDREDRDRNERD